MRRAQAYHLECTTPPLDEVPEGEWYCVPCEERERKVQVRVCVCVCVCVWPCVWPREERERKVQVGR